ncbi:unnamed protein product, partial [Iphiclides podalirius]
MKNEARINVYVWADSSASTSRVHGGGLSKGEGGGQSRSTGGPPPDAIDCPHSAQPPPLNILTGTLTPASPLACNFAQGLRNTSNLVAFYAGVYPL